MGPASHVLASSCGAIRCVSHSVCAHGKKGEQKSATLGVTIGASVPTRSLRLVLTAISFVHVQKQDGLLKWTWCST